MTDWPDIVRHVGQRIQVAKRDGRGLWFRGHRDVDWKLRATVHRYIIDLLEVGGKDVDKDYSKDDHPLMIRDHFKSFYHDFKAKAWDLLAPEERLPWGIIFAMQHYGIPTTLLDCTESFAVATYFANDGRDPDSDAAIFIIDPEEINKNNPLVGKVGLVGLGDEDIETRSTAKSELYHPGIAFEDLPKEEQPPLPAMAISPTLINARMRAQRARFVICGDTFEPLEDSHCSAVQKISLPAATYPNSAEWLELVGMSAFMLFPDLEGVKRDFEEKKKKVRQIVEEIRIGHPEAFC